MSRQPITTSVSDVATVGVLPAPTEEIFYLKSLWEKGLQQGISSAENYPWAFEELFEALNKCSSLSLRDFPSAQRNKGFSNFFEVLGSSLMCGLVLIRDAKENVSKKPDAHFFKQGSMSNNGVLEIGVDIYCDYLKMILNMIDSRIKITEYENKQNKKDTTRQLSFSHSLGVRLPVGLSIKAKLESAIAECATFSDDEKLRLNRWLHEFISKKLWIDEGCHDALNSWARTGSNT